VPITLVDSRNGQPLLFDAHIEDKRSRTSGRTVSVIVDDVPPCRIARLDLIPGDASGAPTPQSPSEPQSENPFRLENDYLAVEVDQKRSCITSLIVRKTGRESVNDNNPLGLNGYIYDRYTVGGTNHASGMVVADVGMLDFLGEWTAAGPAALVESCSEVTAERLTFEYGAAGARRVRTTLTLPRGVPRLDIENRNSKASTLVEEGAYLAFAFKLVDPKTRYELTGGMGGTGLPVVPGAAKHMRAVRRWVSFEEEDLVIGWATQDAPLIELSTVALPYAPFPGTSPEREPGSVYSWVHNNIWDTNFPAEQGFDASFRYSVGVGAGTGPTVGMHTPAGLGHPLIAVLGTAGSPTVLQEWSLLNINDGRVRVTGLTTPAPGEVLVRLQSFAEEGVELRLELGVPVEGAWTANYLAERGEAFEVRERGIRLTIPAMASPAVLVRLPDP
jgi:hypothetical protein